MKKQDPDKIRRDADGALGSLAMGGKPRVDRLVARELLLQSPCTWNGRYLSIIGKSVGAGVWELRLEQEKENQR